MSPKHIHNKTTTEIKQVIPDETAQLAYGETLASAWQKSHESGAFIYLYGDLGAGKTTLVRGFLRHLGHQQIVRSPTYTLVEPYHLAGQLILHVDLYRLANPSELFGLGLLDDLTLNTICLIEWPEHAAHLLPKADLACYIDQLGQGRQIRLLAQTDRGNQILKQWELESQ